MDVNRTLRTISLGLLLAIPSSVSFAQAGRSRYDPASPTGQQSKSKQGFLDFAIGRINPSDKNYGNCIDESRKLLMEETIKNGYFWSNVVALGLLGCLFIIIVYQHQVQARREWTAAEALTESEHAMARANAQVDEATKRNHGLMEAMAALRESALRSHSTSAATSESATAAPTPRRAPVVPAVPTVAAKNSPAKQVDHSAVIATAAEPSVQIGLFRPEVELITKVNSLEQQLGRSEEREKALRRQVSESARKLQAEREQNRTLKGE